MKNMTAKRWLLVAAAVVLLLAAGVAHYRVKYGSPLPQGHVVLWDVEITEVFTHDNEGGSLHILKDGAPKGINLQRSTRIYDKDGKRIPIERLAVGQHINAYVSSTVFYEPYDTYVECYRIFVR